MQFQNEELVLNWTVISRLLTLFLSGKRVASSPVFYFHLEAAEMLSWFINRPGDKEIYVLLANLQ